MTSTTELRRRLGLIPAEQPTATATAEDAAQAERARRFHTDNITR